MSFFVYSARLQKYKFNSFREDFSLENSHAIVRPVFLTGADDTDNADFLFVYLKNPRHPCHPRLIISQHLTGQPAGRPLPRRDFPRPVSPASHLR